MNLTFDSIFVLTVFIFVSAIYVCSLLWLYGDATARQAQRLGVIFVMVFLLLGALVLTQGWLPLTVLWLLGYGLWFVMRPAVVANATDTE